MGNLKPFTDFSLGLKSVKTCAFEEYFPDKENHNRQMILLLAGGCVCFGIGIIDDFRGVRPTLKLLFQIIGSTLAFWGGIKFSHFQTAKRAVLVIYSITFGLCVLAVLMVNIRDERAGLFLIVLGAGAVIFIRKLGYFEYFATDKIYGWFRDLTDEAGFSHDRRTFLSIQIEIGNSKSIQAMWDNVSQALKLLDFDFAALYLNNLKNNGLNTSAGYNGIERRNTPVSMSSVSMRKEPPDWVCPLESIKDAAQLCSRCLFRLEMQLFVKDSRNYGTLLLLKDLDRSAMDNFTLKRIESLRRSMISAFESLEKSGTLREGKEREEGSKK